MRLLRLIVAAWVWVAGIQLAGATTATGTISVGLTVTTICSTSATAMAFPSMSTGTTTLGTASSTLTVTCSNGAPYTVALDSGQNVLLVQRRMRRATSSDYISYNLFSDSAFSLPWILLSGQVGTGSGQSITIYGAVPATQAVPDAGNYSDQVTITITY